VFVKAESLQRTGSFKFRGAYNRVSRLSSDERHKGVVAYSSGNHAQGVAAAARMTGCPAVIVMPADAPAAKLEATRALGAEVVVYDRFGQSREDIAADIAERSGAVVVRPFDDPWVIAGQGTVGLETLDQLRAAGAGADVLLCPASGGGLMAGVALAFEEWSPETALYTAEPAGFDDHARSLKAGRRVTNPAGSRSLCDALMAPEPGEITFAINQPRLSGGYVVSDEEALQAMAFAFRHLKLVVEPGGAAALAVLLSGRAELGGRTAVAVVSGGNVDPAVFVRALGVAS
jgi:threonine dehydratase